MWAKARQRRAHHFGATLAMVGTLRFPHPYGRRRRREDGAAREQPATWVTLQTDDMGNTILVSFRS
ncbi:hypothetical protein AAFX91_31885, partial [Bradyrhizobium sp. 31Argb]|uniref:hypothetical protein n=1 Tax=Bradyrhizobium sp. 31Argb TaxID=3141247 RepID=UPI003748ACB0